MNKQREVIYGERRKILEGTDTHSNLLNMMERLVNTETPTFCEGRNRKSWDLEGLWERFRQIAPMAPVDEVDLDSLGDTVADIADALLNELTAMYEEKETQYGEGTMRYVEQRVMLEVIDQKWRAYLTQMDHLREGVGLVGYGQKDPLMEYKSQAFEAFSELSDEIQRDIVRLLMHVQIQLQPQQQAQIEGAEVEVEEVAADGDGEDGPEAALDDTGPDEAGPDSPPAARPAAAQASAGLARAAERARTTPGAAPAAAAADGGLRGVLAAAPPPRVRNVVESSSEGTRAASGSPAEGNGGATSGHKVGRNEPCPCGSGLKYKRCHGRFE